MEKIKQIKENEVVDRITREEDIVVTSNEKCSEFGIGTTVKMASIVQ